MRFKIVLLIAITLCRYGLADAFVKGDPAVINLVATTYSLGGFPRATSLSDIDSDGDSDIIVTNPDKHEIVILLNKGDGAFEIGDNYPITGYPISIISTDIDGDSDIDLVVLDSFGRVRILKQEQGSGGDRSFSAGGVYPVELYSFSISASDMDSDGDPDLVVLSEKKTTILLNDGKGGFDVTLSYPSVNPTSKIAADLNSDNRGDIIIGGKEGISVLLNNGDNTFAEGVYYAAGKMPMSVVAGDLDSDGDNDLVVANFKSHTLSILKNNGDGTFQDAVDYPSGKGPNSITPGDIDLDGDLDIVVTNGLSGDVAIFINNTVRPLAITTKSLPQGRRSQYYGEKLKAKGGIPPYSWAITSGSLPPGVDLDPLTGEMVSRHETDGTGEEKNSHKHHHEDMGEPLLSMEAPCMCLKAPHGLYRFTVQATDSSSATAVADLYIEVVPVPGTISGTIKYSGNKKGTIRVGLWPTAVQTNFIGKGIFNATVTTSGEYKIENIYPESYVAGAFLDINGDGMRQVDEPYGMFGPTEKPEAVVVDDGDELSDIDMELSEN